MKIVLDGRCLQTNKKHGIARYTENLIKNLPLTEQEQLIVLYNSEYFEPWVQNQVEWQDISTELLSLKEQFTIPRILRALKPDLFHSPSYVIPFQVPCPYVMTIHDLIHVKYPQDYSLWHKLYYRFWVKPRALKAKHLLTVSEYSKKEIANWLHKPQEITVSPLGVESRFQPLELWITTVKKYPVEMPFVLYIGNEKPHKNFEAVFHAFELFVDHHGPICNLVVLGIDKEFQRKHPQVQYLPVVPDADLPSFYAGARMLLCPSFEEGFGLPVLEAMACGTPVVISDIPVFKELVGDAGTYVSPKRQMELVEAMAIILSNRDMTRFMKQKGQEKAKQFLWEKTAWKTWKVYQEIVGHGKT